MSLADSEGDIAQITNHISSVKDILTKLKMVRMCETCQTFSYSDSVLKET